MPYKLFILACLAVFSSCERIPSKTIHPTESNLFNNEEVSSIISNDTLTDNAELTRLAQEIKRAESVMELGSSEDNILGNVIDVSFNDDFIYLLDEQKMNVSVYNAKGKYILSTARRGKGPGELINPESIIASGNHLFILNNHYDVQVYKKGSIDNEYKPHDQLSLNIRPDDMCLTNDKLFVNTLPISDANSDLQDNYNILVFDLADFSTVINEFGSMYNTDSWFVKMHMSMGGIECSPESNTIVQYFRNIGQLIAYNPNGETKWKLKFDDFNHLKLIEQAGSLGPDRNNPQNDFDSIENLIYINDQYFITQVFNRELLSDRYETKIKTYIINFDTGEGIYVSSDIPKIMSVDYNKRIYTTYNIDKSTVSVFKF